MASAESGIDLIVVGAGTAGIPCAIEAGRAGASVLLIEQEPEIGGTLHVSGGQMSAAGSRLQRSRGIEDTPDEHFAEVMALGHGNNDAALVRLAVEEAPRTIDWLEELGFPFPASNPVIYHGHQPYSKPRTYWGRELGMSILNVLEPGLLDLAGSGQVELRLETRLIDLVEDDGAVVGVTVDGPTGRARVLGSSVVLATGGYAGSHAAFALRHPGLRCLLGGRPSSTGEGIRAAERVGARFRGAEHFLPTVGCIETIPGTGRCELWESFANLSPYYRQPREIYVNARGERFIREDAPSPDERERALVAQGGRFWIVFDSAALDEDDPLVIGWSIEMLEDRAASGQGAWRADDLGALAARAGIDADGLGRTVAEFNRAAAAGTDRLGREELTGQLTQPPWYALLIETGTTISFGGIAIDDELRVVDQADQPIPGLYAAGEILGAAALMGDAYCGGMGVTPALGFGRILGRRLARAAHARAQQAV